MPKRSFEIGSRMPILILLLTLFICVPSVLSAQVEFIIDPVSGPNFGFGPLCGLISSTDTHLVRLVTGTTALTSVCNLTTVDAIICHTSSCGIDFGSSGSFVVSSMPNRPLLNVQGVNIVSTSSSNDPAFMVEGAVTLSLSVGTTSSLTRPLAQVKNNGLLRIVDSVIELDADNGIAEAISVTGGKLELENSGFYGAVRRSPFIRAVDSAITIRAGGWSNNHMIASSTTSEVAIIDALRSIVNVSGVLVQANYVDMTASFVHGKLFSIRDSSLLVETSKFMNSIFTTTTNSLGSVFSLQRSNYTVTTSEFLGSTSSGCTYIHGVNSFGSITSSKVWTASINGIPAENISNGTAYAPYEYPTLAAAICLTRNLSTLAADYGSAFSATTPDDLRWNDHTLYNVSFTGNKFPNIQSTHFRNAMTEKETFYHLYATDVWASNVRLLLKDNIHSAGDLKLAAIRVDACDVIFGGQDITDVSMAAWIDFGSEVRFGGGISSLQFYMAAIYGAAPYRTSKYTGQAGGSVIRFLAPHTLQFRSIITGGIMERITLSIEANHTLTVCCSWPEERNYPYLGSPPFQDALEFRSTSYIQTYVDSNVTMARKTTPWIITGDLDVDGLLHAPRLGASVIQAANVRFGAESNLRVVDLQLRAKVTLSPSMKLAIAVSRFNNIFHGLDVQGLLTCSLNTAMQIHPYSANFDLLLDPIYLWQPLLRGPASAVIPVLRYSASDTCTMPSLGSTSYVPAFGNFVFLGMNALTSDASFVLQSVDVQGYWHPTHVAIICDFPFNIRETGLIQADCSGFLTSSGYRCDWLTSRQLRVALTGAGTLGLALPVNTARFVFAQSLIPSTYLPQVATRALIQLPFLPVRPTGTIDLDARLSSNGAEPMVSTGLTWTSDMAADTVVSNSLTASYGVWKVPLPQLSQPGIYTITATPSNPWTNRGLFINNVQIWKSDTVTTMTDYCKEPSVRIEGGHQMLIYEDTRPHFWLRFDPLCDLKDTFGINAIRWSIHFPNTSVLELDMNDNRTTLQMPALYRPSLAVGAFLRVVASVMYNSSVERVSSLWMAFQVSAPVISSTFFHEFNPTRLMSAGIVVSVEPNTGVTYSTTQAYALCPVPAIEITRGAPFSDPLPSPEVENSCRSDNAQRSLYGLTWSTSSAGLLSVGVGPTWHSANHRFSFSSRLSLSVSQAYDFTIESELKVANPFDKELVKIEFARFTWKQRSSQLVSDRVLALTVRFNNGSLCQGCIYTWKSNPSLIDLVSLPKSTVFASRLSDAVVDFYVNVTYPTSSGWITTEARKTIKMGQQPKGGESRLVAASAGSTATLSALGWGTDYPSIRYLFGWTDCRQNFRVAQYWSYSPVLENTPVPTTECTQINAEVIVMDGIGAESETTIFITTQPARIDWNSPVSALPDFIQGFADSAAKGDLDRVLPYLNSMDQLASLENTALWLAQKDILVPKIITALNQLSTVPHIELMISTTFSNATILKMMDSHALAGQILEIALSSPVDGIGRLSVLCRQSRMKMIEAVYVSYFGPQLPASTYRNRLQNWKTLVSRSSEVWTRLHTSMASGFSHWQVSSGDWVQTTASAVDVQSILSDATEVPLALSTSISLVSMDPSLFKRSTVAGSSSIWEDPILPTTCMVFLEVFSMLPVDHVLAPIRSVVRVETTLAGFSRQGWPTERQLELVQGWVRVSFDVQTAIVPNHDRLVCASIQGFSDLWKSNCAKETVTVNPGSVRLFCRCTVSGTTSIQTSIALLMPEALCGEVPPSGSFVCTNGQWISSGSVEEPVVTIPSTGEVTVVGNLTVETLTFSGLGGTVNVTGCTKIGTEITIQLTLAELEALIASGEITTLLLVSTGCDISDLKDVPISVLVDAPGRCEKVTVTSESSSTTLSGIFKVDDTGCKKKSSTWWIILVSVLGGIIVIVGILTILGTMTPLKHIIRPHAKRAQESNTYYMNEGQTN